MNTKYLPRRQKIKFKIRKKISGTAEKPRLVVYRSLVHIYANLVDDVNRVTIMSVSTKDKVVSDKISGLKGKITKSKEVGKTLAEIAKSRNIDSVVFDRNGYLYHGRVKAVADGAREGGLKF